MVLGILRLIHGGVIFKSWKARRGKEYATVMATTNFVRHFRIPFLPHTDYIHMLFLPLPIPSIFQDFLSHQMVTQYSQCELLYTPSSLHAVLPEGTRIVIIVGLLIGILTVGLISAQPTALNRLICPAQLMRINLFCQSRSEFPVSFTDQHARLV